jgi:chromosomal replication initiation ATPase DnaA
MKDVFAELQKAFPQVRKRSAVMRIVEDVAERSGVSKFQILSRSRLSEYVEARDEVILKAKKSLKISNAQLGRILGGRKHSTITYSLKRSLRLPHP